MMYIGIRTLAMAPFLSCGGGDLLESSPWSRLPTRYPSYEGIRKMGLVSSPRSDVFVLV
jgi:hypothetical protein